MTSEKRRAQWRIASKNNREKKRNSEWMQYQRRIKKKWLKFLDEFLSHLISEDNIK